MIPLKSALSRVGPPLAALALAACGQGSADPFAGFGATPQLPPPKSSLIPTLNARQAVGWPPGAAPVAPAGFTVTVRSVTVSAGAGFLVALTGDVLTMPGLPKHPAAENMDIDESGKITGLF